MALQDVGAFFGMIVFTVVTARIGRRKTFGLSFLACFVVVFGVFGFMNQEWQIYLLVPLVGFTTLTVFGGYAIYLPELFPTRLRSTGTSLCYNAARFLTAIGVVHDGVPHAALQLVGLRRAVPVGHLQRGLHLPRRHRRAAVRPRDQGPAVARVTMCTCVICAFGSRLRYYRAERLNDDQTLNAR